MVKELARKITKWSVATKLLPLPIKLWWRTVVSIIYYAYAILNKNTQVVIFYNVYNDPGRIKILNLIKKIKKQNEILLSDNEAYQIFMLVKKTEKIIGDIAEVGVYRGGSAKIICEAKKNKFLHLFDTFEGLPELSEKDDVSQVHEGEYSASFKEVKDFLKEYSNVRFYKGLFPSTIITKSVENKKFSFVHLDVDIYESTINCLKFFYPRMNRSGVIVSHDYISAAGVTRAFDEFFKDKPEVIIELSCSQCLVVKA